jgi:hypothetical protein
MAIVGVILEGGLEATVDNDANDTADCFLLTDGPDTTGGGEGGLHDTGVVAMDICKGLLSQVIVECFLLPAEMMETAETEPISIGRLHLLVQ